MSRYGNNKGIIKSMKKEKRPPLNFRFHNPNSLETTIDLIVSVFIEVNKKKLMEEVDKEIEKMNEEVPKS